MTRATGKRAAVRRREELFAAEIELRGVQRHLLEAYSWASLLRAPDHALGIMGAFGVVSEALCKVLAEVAAMDCEPATVN